MTLWSCVVYNGFRFSGCTANISENGMEIICIFRVVYKLHHSRIIKVIKFDKTKSWFRIEFNIGTRKNEVFDLKISFQRKAFIEHVESLGWEIETRERYEREITY
jgi:hypothetical protein